VELQEEIVEDKYEAGPHWAEYTDFNLLLPATT